ncbi:MAG: hypothetical protein WD646_01115 [Actinomycetota bacterium]
MYRLASLALLLLVACSSPGTPEAHRVISTPVPTGNAEVALVLAPTPAPKPKNAAPSKPKALAAEQAPAPVPLGVKSAPLPGSNGTTAFQALGAWIDVFDHSDDPNTILPLVRGVAKQGARTLYLETARYTSETDIQFPKAMGAALDEAKQLGLRVVAWYPPGFADLDRDVRRSLAAIKFRSPGGNRFDAFGADIEYTAALPDHAERTKRTIQYSERLRAGAPGYPLAAIVIPPTSLEVNPGRWPNFPWQAIAPFYEVFMPMNYWTAREKSAKAASDLTTRNVDETERLTGRPVHIIGGLGEFADEAQVAAFVKAAKQSGSLGGGLYDYRTTRAEVWDELRGLN